MQQIINLTIQSFTYYHPKYIKKSQNKTLHTLILPIKRNAIVVFITFLCNFVRHKFISFF